MNSITFSINEYDSDGDVRRFGVVLHFGDTAIRVCDTIEGFDDVVKNILAIQAEIKDTGETL